MDQFPVLMKMMRITFNLLNLNEMKKTFKLIMIAAAMCAVSISCVKEETDAEKSVVNDKVNITITAGNELADTDTKTVYDPVEQTISWGDQATEKLTVFELLSNGTLSNVTANCTSVTEGKATFNAQFDALPEETDLTYFAVYPETAWSYWVDPTTINRVPARIEATQNPTATSFDPKFDFLFSMAEKKDAQPTAIDFSFGRVVALVKVNFTNLPAGNVKTVTLNADGKAIKGMLFVDVEKGFLTKELAETGSEITLDYTGKEAAVADGKFTAWFCTVPFTMDEGDNMHLTVVYDNETTCSRTIAAPAGGMEFNMGKIRPLNVNMEDAKVGFEIDVVCTMDNLRGKEGDPRINDGWIQGLFAWARYVEFDVDVPTAGTYYMYTQVQNWNTNVRPFSVSVNGTKLRTYVIPSRYDYYSPEVCFEMQLNAGKNTVKIHMDESEVIFPYRVAGDFEWMPNIKNSFAFSSVKRDTPYYQVIKPMDCEVLTGTKEGYVVISENVITCNRRSLYEGGENPGFRFKVNVPKDGTYSFMTEICGVHWHNYNFKLVVDDDANTAVNCTFKYESWYKDGSDVHSHSIYSRTIDLPEGEHWISVCPVWVTVDDKGNSIVNEGCDAPVDQAYFDFPEQFYEFTIAEW